MFIFASHLLKWFSALKYYILFISHCKCTIMTNFALIATVNTCSVVLLLLKRALKCNISYQLISQIVVCDYIISRSHAVTCT